MPQGASTPPAHCISRQSQLAFADRGILIGSQQFVFHGADILGTECMSVCCAVVADGWMLEG